MVPRLSRSRWGAPRSWVLAWRELQASRGVSVSAMARAQVHPADRPGSADGPAWAEDFLFAGSSALLLLLACLWPDLWFISFLALVPFLHRVIRANPAQALRLGLLLGFSYFTINLATPLYTHTTATVVRLMTAIALCGAFGWAVAAVRRRCGFNPLVTALLWVVFELILIRAGFAHGLLAEMDVSTGLLFRLGILFGFLAVSFIIVLFNAILVLAIEKAVELARARGTVYPESERTWDPFLTPGLVAQKLYLASANRAPPQSV